MAKYRIGAKLIDSYRLYMGGDWMSLDKLKDDISGVFTWNKKMKIGTSFQSAVEDIMVNKNIHCSEENSNYVRSSKGEEQMYFNMHCFNELFEMMPKTAIPEIKQVLEYDTKYGKVQVACKTDAAHGHYGYDVKTSLSAMDPDNYIDTYQWRYYAVAFGFKFFKWPLVKLKESKKMDGHYDLVSLTEANQNSYNGIEDDCRVKLIEFLDFVNSIGLMEELRPYWEKKNV